MPKTLAPRIERMAFRSSMSAATSAEAVDSLSSATPRIARVPIGIARIVLATTVLGILGYTYVLGIPSDGANPFDYFGYFTNLTSLLTSIILVLAGLGILRSRPEPLWLSTARGVLTACMIIVGVIYNVLVPGTGSAPFWVSAILHIVFPAMVVADWFLVRDHAPLRWRDMWLVLPYPLVWLSVVLIRGMTDGWVPYGFLLPERGLASLLAHLLGLLCTLVAAATVVWASAQHRHSPSQR